MLKEGFLFTFISAFMALFPVANPVGAGFLVNGLLSGLNDEDRRSIIRRIVTDYLLVGLGSLAVGHFVLSLFGLSLPVIQLGGGLLICRTALQRRARTSTPFTNRPSSRRSSTRSPFPSASARAASRSS